MRHHQVGLRAGALLALLVTLPSLAKPPHLHKVGDGVLLEEPALEISPAAEVVQVNRGLVWAVLQDGHPARQATKVPAGVYLTAAGWANASKAFDARGAEITRLAAEVDALRAQLRELAAQPEPLVGVLPPLVDLSPVPQPEVKPQQGGASGVLWALGVGLVVGAVGGAYLTARALR